MVREQQLVLKSDLITRYESIDILVGVKSPSLVDAFRTDEEKIARRYKNAKRISFPGRATIDDIYLLDEEHILVIGEKIQEIELEKYILYGVIPIEREDDSVLCVIDYYKEK